MDKFVHEENLKHYRKLLAGTTHEAQRPHILKLLVEEEAKDWQPAGHYKPPLLAATFISNHACNVGYWHKANI